MRKLFGKKVNLDQSLIFPTGVFLIVLVSFFLLIPKVASTVIPAKRQLLLSNFLNTVKEKNFINAQQYWEFREFYSPGYFDFKRTGISSREVQNALGQMNVPIVLGNRTIPFLHFHSRYLESLDVLVTTDTQLESFFTKTQLTDKRILFQDKNSLIFEDKNRIVIIFLKNLNEMKTANGFFDYGEKDLEFVKNKNWLNVTKLIKP